MKLDVLEKSGSAFDGKAIRRPITILFLLLYLPAAAKSRVPVLLNLSFSANSRTVDDPAVRTGEVWNREHKRVPAAQGMAIGRVTRVPDLLDAGFGFATIYYGDIEPDFAGGAQYGIRGAYLKAGQSEPGPSDW